MELRNIKANFNVLDLGKGNKFYFSYETVIAFEIDYKLYISENRWSGTTGKHLNYINENKKIRLKELDFEIELEKATRKFL